MKQTNLQQHQKVAEILTKAGFEMSAEDVQAHMQSFLIISRPIDKIVHKIEDDGDPEIETTEDDRPVTKPFIM